MTALGESPEPTTLNISSGYDGKFDPALLASDRYPVYLDLLVDRLVPDDSIDAIVVPSARSAQNIRAAAELAKLTTTKLVVLCSHDSNSKDVADLLDDKKVASWLAIDMPDDYEIPFVNLASTSAIPESTRRYKPSNLSDKRNAGIAMGLMLNWHKLLFIDDDIVVSPKGLSNMSLMLPSCQVAGLRCGGYPDKSVVNHALDLLRYMHFFRRYSPTSPAAGHISGNSILVDPHTSGLFFPPEIYDEDLFAFYDQYDNRTGALAEGSYSQAAYDPFADPDRARTEEFGEILTDGLYEPMRLRYRADLSDPMYWRGMADKRLALIENLIAGVAVPPDRRNFTYMSELPKATDEQKAKLTNSLEQARVTNESITGAMCVDYFRAWRCDQEHWRQELVELPRFGTAQSALGKLGLYFYEHTSPESV